MRSKYKIEFIGDKLASREIVEPHNPLDSHGVVCLSQPQQDYAHETLFLFIQKGQGPQGDYITMEYSIRKWSCYQGEAYRDLFLDQPVLQVS